MRSLRTRSLSGVAFVVVVATAGMSQAAIGSNDSLLEQPHPTTEREARIALGEDAECVGLVGFEPIVEDRVPNYLRVFSGIPGAAEAMAELSRSVLYDGRVEPDVKMAMGLAIADADRTPYSAAHMRRLLAATERGRTLMEAIHRDLNELSDADRLVIQYALALTESVKGFDDETFSELRRHYNEPQIVELTLVACFFNYFNRIVEPLNLPVETWALKPAYSRGDYGSYSPPEARIGLLTNEEVRTITHRIEQDELTSSLGVAVPNSIRAMARASDIQSAWWRLWQVTSVESVIGDEMQHYVSNEVSYRNDCYYCITHQVEKLKRAGVAIETIARAANDPAMLPKQTRTAVYFARQVTDDPISVSDAELAELSAMFSEQGAFEILHVAARFNFMNRFTSGLDLPSESGPIATYEQVQEARAGDNAPPRILMEDR